MGLWKVIALAIFLGVLGALVMYFMVSPRRDECFAKHGEFVCMGHGGCVCLKPGTVL